MLQNIKLFKQSLKDILLSSAGLSIESEATVYIRSLEGNNIVAGILDDEGGIKKEIEFNQDIDKAIKFFISERDKLNHGC